jgi:glycosyltransferase involved in cell wall biosynthesis
LERWKGHALLLSALGKLKDLELWECWIVGGLQRQHEERYLEELKTQAQDLGISDHIKFLGQRSDVPNLLRAANIHCQPNIGAETFGDTFIEALYAGLPVASWLSLIIFWNYLWLCDRSLTINAKDKN